MPDPIRLFVTKTTLAISDHEGAGDVTWEVTIVVDAPLTIVRTVRLECGHGGYVFSLKEEFGTLLGQGPTIATLTTTTATQGSAEPVAALVLYCEYIDSRQPGVERAALLQLPVAFDANTTWGTSVDSAPTTRALAVPDALPQGRVEQGVFLTAMAPVDVVDIITKRDGDLVTRRVLLLTGQILNLKRNAKLAAAMSDAKPRFDRWHLTVHDACEGNNPIDREVWIRDDWPGFKGSKFLDQTDLGGWFCLPIDLPHSFSFGDFSLHLIVDDVDVTYSRATRFEAADRLHLPMDPQEYLFTDARINFGGGPAARNGRDNGHNRSVKERYAYDLGTYVNGSDLRPFMSGTLDAYWSFGSPILAMADGVVTRVEMADADQLDSSGRGNRVTLRHDDARGPRYSVYAHCRKGSATVNVNDTVRAGQKLAEVGSTGGSSHPHLHVAYYEFDSWARARMLPMAFTVEATSDTTVTGVPESDLRVDPPLGTGNANPGFWATLVATVTEIWRSLPRPG